MLSNFQSYGFVRLESILRGADLRDFILRWSPDGPIQAQLLQNAAGLQFGHDS